MGRKVRKQLNIDDKQDLLLKHEAERLGVSESEVVRRALDAWIQQDAGSRRRRAYQRLLDLQVEIEKRWIAAGRPTFDYTFNRQELYDEDPRMKRYDEP
jgi:hypothetical protein